jgi:hypothetical protein
MRRRVVFALLGCAAAWPLGVSGQQHPPMGVPAGGTHHPVIGFLYAVLGAEYGFRTDPKGADLLRAILDTKRGAAKKVKERGTPTTMRELESPRCQSRARSAGTRRMLGHLRSAAERK